MKKSLFIILISIFCASAFSNKKIYHSYDQFLVKAVNNNNVSEVRKYLINGADANSKNKFGIPIVIIASYNGNVLIVNLLLKNGANINTQDRDADTALHNAIYKNHYNVVELLLKNNVNVNAQNNQGLTPLMVAVKNGFSKIIFELLKYSANTTSKDKTGRNALDYAYLFGQDNIIFAIWKVTYPSRMINCDTLDIDKIMAIVMDRTLKDLKNLGIRNILLSNGGNWMDTICVAYVFSNDGKFHLSYKGRKWGYGFWKVINGKLYINPNQILHIYNKNKFYFIKIKAVPHFPYSPASINMVRYALCLESQNSEFSICIQSFDRKVINILR